MSKLIKDEDRKEFLDNQKKMAEDTIITKEEKKKKEFDVKLVVDLMNESYLDGVDTVVGVLQEAMTNYLKSGKLTKDMKGGIALIGNVLVSTQEEIHTNDFMGDVMKDFLAKAARRDLASMKKPFYKLKKKGKVKL